MDMEKFQEQLVDVSSSGRVRPWKDKKIKNLLLSKLYRAVDSKKSIRLRECATFLRFSIKSSDSLCLKSGNFCKVRLCPMCTWRRSLKIFGQVKSIMDGIQSENDYAYLFLTLTVINCDGEDLSNRLDEMMMAWKRFLKLVVPRGFMRGWYRGLEITHNVFDNTYHPHFHCVLAVEKSYFAWKNYVSQKGWTTLWKKALNVKYTPVVNIKRTYGPIAKSVAEMAKYSVKDADYIKPEDWELSEEIVRCLDKVLMHRRLIAFGGVFREWHKKLNLDDAVDGDLVHVDSECLEEDEKGLILSYEWNVGYQQYRRVD
uniref:Replication protein n=1 Tax=uncultured prokaryote TaxID=198431 RepID=A0A0H5Q3L1_9ZZZZ|nr:hypothetical protein [uncultured prokaryote]